jgi:hypothetical protein
MQNASVEILGPGVKQQGGLRPQPKERFSAHPFVPTYVMTRTENLLVFVAVPHG